MDEHTDEHTAQERTPDPDAAVVQRGDETPAEGRDEDDEMAEDSLPPSSGTKTAGPRSDVDRAQPYDEQPGGLRMVEQPVDGDQP